MRIPNLHAGSSLRFNITPLIDVVFQLIIFFLVASHFVRHESHAPVELPDATRQERDEDGPKRITITVTADGQLHLGETPVELAEVEALITAGERKSPGVFEVRLRGDKAVTYRAVEPILLACARAQVRHVKFAVNVVP